MGLRAIVSGWWILREPGATCFRRITYGATPGVAAEGVSSRMFAPQEKRSENSGSPAPHMLPDRLLATQHRALRQKVFRVEYLRRKKPSEEGGNAVDAATAFRFLVDTKSSRVQDVSLGDSPLRSGREFRTGTGRDMYPLEEVAHERTTRVRRTGYRATRFDVRIRLASLADGRQIVGVPNRIESQIKLTAELHGRSVAHCCPAQPVDYCCCWQRQHDGRVILEPCQTVC